MIDFDTEVDNESSNRFPKFDDYAMRYYANQYKKYNKTKIVDGKEIPDREKILNLNKTLEKNREALIRIDDLNKEIHCKFLPISKYYCYANNGLPFTRRVVDDFPRLKYEKTHAYYTRSTKHIGQRKLLLSEIEFLTLAHEKAIQKGEDKRFLVIYVGAGPGTHIPYVANLFKTDLFHLYDMTFADNFAKLNALPNVKAFNDFFTDKTTDDYVGDKAKYSKEKLKYDEILFISDIRRVDIEEGKMEETVYEDMMMQQGWVKKIQPFASMLKFRLPYSSVVNGEVVAQNIKYINGICYFGVFAPLTSTETRLISFRENGDYKNEKIWNSVKYEQQLFYFNNVYRMCIFNHNVDEKCTCRCHDCTSEVYILTHYCNLKGIKCTVGTIRKMIGDINEASSRDKCQENLNPKDKQEKMDHRVDKSEYGKKKKAAQSAKGYISSLKK